MADRTQSPEEAGTERESAPNDAQTVPKAPDDPTARGDTSRTAKGRTLEEVGDLSDFPEGTHKVVQVGGRQIGIFNIRGEFYGLPNVCPHQTGPLCEGARTTGTLVADADSGWQPRWALDGEVIACPWHGLEYHVPTGRCLAYPAITLRRYPVRVDGEDVVVSVGR